jgi:hypothetical protein
MAATDPRATNPRRNRDHQRRRMVQVQSCTRAGRNSTFRAAATVVDGILRAQAQKNPPRASGSRHGAVYRTCTDQGKDPTPARGTLNCNRFQGLPPKTAGFHSADRISVATRPL